MMEEPKKKERDKKSIEDMTGRKKGRNMDIRGQQGRNQNEGHKM